MAKKIIGVLRILLGVFMVVMGVMKFGAPAEKIAEIGGAGAALGLGFLSATIWFWIAVAGEIVAGILLIMGHWSKIGALLTLIIMVFAVNATGFNPMAIGTTLVALIVLVAGPGAFSMCKSCKTCSDGSCDITSRGKQQQQQQQ